MEEEAEARLLKGTEADMGRTTMQQRRSTELSLAVLALVMLSIVLIPLPPVAIDFGLAASLAISILILSLVLSLERTVDFSSFPTVLLLVTLLRLALNIATTRQVLANGHEGTSAAGHVIAAFADIVMGGDFIVGAIIFLIIILINFIVISKGASRIAEVAARFSLDAMPGKQMSIDADLTAGLIDEAEATRRRLAIEEESAFYGAMDGASKFIRGDAIAGIIITMVNVLGGIAVGVWRQGLTGSQAVDIYVKLAVGDGLLTQIPALVVSLAAGFLVSNGVSKVSAGRAIGNQILRSHKAPLLTGGCMGLIGLLPGFPLFPFLILGLSGLAFGYFARAAAERAVVPGPTARSAKQADRIKKEDVDEHRAGLLEVKCGTRVARSLIAKSIEFIERTRRLRVDIGKQYGLDVPEVAFNADPSLGPDAYRVIIGGVPVARGELRVGHLLVVVGNGAVPSATGEATVDPAFGLRALWVPEENRAGLKAEKFVGVDGPSVLLTHLGEVVKSHLSEIMSYQELRRMLDRLPVEYRKLVEEITPSHISNSTLLLVLRGLLAERVSVRNLAEILEAVAEIAPFSRKWETIVEHVRVRLGRQICAEFGDDGNLRMVRIGLQWEKMFGQSFRRDQKGEIVDCILDPAALERFGVSASSEIARQKEIGGKFVVATSSEARPWLRVIMQRMFPDIPVVAHGEVALAMSSEYIGAIE